jgi:hypothetical protein
VPTSEFVAVCESERMVRVTSWIGFAVAAHTAAGEVSETIKHARGRSRVYCTLQKPLETGASST